MIVERKGSQKKTLFGNLDKGTVFELNSAVFIKVRTADCCNNAFNVASDICCELNPEAQVIPLKAKLVIEEE